MPGKERAGRYGRVAARRFPAFAPLLAGFAPYTAVLKGLRSVVWHPDAVAEFTYDGQLPVWTAYLLAAAVVEPAELATARPLLRALGQGAQPRVHFHTEGDFQTEGDACRRKIIAELVAAGLRTRIYVARGRDEAVRRRTVLGPRPSAAGLEYEHLRAREEPLLWVPDAVAWCYGAGGDWRRRVSPLVDAVINGGCPT